MDKAIIDNIFNEYGYIIEKQKINGKYRYVVFTFNYGFVGYCNTILQAYNLILNDTAVFR